MSNQKNLLLIDYENDSDDVVEKMNTAIEQHESF
jgi:hypothetical protein